MPSGWNVYYIVFLSAVVALGIPIILWLLSLVLMSKISSKKGIPEFKELTGFVPPAKAAPAEAFRRTNTRFFLGANAALILLALTMVLIPCVGTIRHHDTELSTVRGFVCVISVAFFAGLGLLYAARKGDLSWLRSFTKEPE